MSERGHRRYIATVTGMGGHSPEPAMEHNIGQSAMALRLVLLVRAAH